MYYDKHPFRTAAIATSSSSCHLYQVPAPKNAITNMGLTMVTHLISASRTAPVTKWYLNLSSMGSVA